MSKYCQEDGVFPMLYVASYNELEQLHMQVLSNYHLAAFLKSLDMWVNMDTTYVTVNL